MANKRPSEPKGLSFDVDEFMFPQNGQRLGKLIVQGRTAINTPHYLAVSSKGFVPHLSQDMARKSTDIQGIYAALEDCKCCPPMEM